MTDVDLVLLTSTFPFGSIAEPFLETELPILARSFRSVYLLPSNLDDGVTREIPPNASIVRMPWLGGYGGLARRRALATREAAQVLGWSLSNWRDLVRQTQRPRVYGDILAQNVLRARDLSRFVQSRGLQDALFYDYWFENSTLALSLVRARGDVTAAVCRAHRFDIYDESWGGFPVPFRQAKARHLDAVFPVSSHGAAYLADKVPQLTPKLRVHRLGVTDPCVGSPEPLPGSPPLIVTCARLIPGKRVHLVPDALAAMRRPFQWIHLGDGPERTRVARAAERVLPADTWEIKGALSNRDLLDFYRFRSVQLLLSLSESEGIPVSMMEAQSFGIPIVACAVGGVPEVVSERSGALVAATASSGAVADAICRVLDARDLTREAVRSEFRSKYDAESNYGAFVDDILTIRARPAPAA